jgi:hypothetical protein
MKADQSDDELLDNPNRIPVFNKNNYYYDDQTKDFLDDLKNSQAKRKKNLRMNTGRLQMLI